MSVGSSQVTENITDPSYVISLENSPYLLDEETLTSMTNPTQSGDFLQEEGRLYTAKSAGSLEDVFSSVSEDFDGRDEPTNEFYG